MSDTNFTKSQHIQDSEYAKDTITNESANKGHFISFIEKTKGQLASNMSKKIPNKNDQTNADG